MDENFCTYINSVGFQKSSDISAFYTMNNEIFNNSTIKRIVYVKTDLIYDFSKLINNVNDSFILVTGCSDYTIPDDMFPNVETFIEFIGNKKIIKWFVQNCTYKHDKIVNLPIGLDFHTLNSNINIFWGPNMSPIEQERQIVSIKNNSKPFYERNVLIYSNCHFLTTTKFGGDRLDAINTIPNNLLYLENDRVPRINSWEKQSNYAFVLSPHGNGLDCHRTWEAIVLGCIPIVKKSQIDILYDDLPVLIINNWNEITEELLNRTIIDFKNRNFNFNKMTLKYWTDLMRKIFDENM